MLKKIILSIPAILSIILLIAAFAYFYPGSAEGLHRAEAFEILAHRGLHTNWEKGAYDLATGCEATHIFEPTTEYIENTIESIEAAFAAGATMVEVDIRPSADGVLMINHEEDLACKTDGSGKIYEHTVEELKLLDVGYGFTHDGGQTYPYRGQGVGKMPTLVEVLEAFPDGRFLIDHKDRSQETGELLVETLREFPLEQRANILYWGSPAVGDFITGELPEVQRLLATRAELRSCIERYMLTLGFDLSNTCDNLGVGMNRQYARLLWGFPYRFIREVRNHNGRVFLLVDSQDDIEWARDLPIDGVITDYIETVGPAFAE